MNAENLPILLLLPLLVLALWWTRRRQQDSAENSASRPEPRHDALDTVEGWLPEATPLMTLREREALALVEMALPDYKVMSQVPLSRFIRVPTRNSYAEWSRRVGQSCADLLVCDADSRVVAVIDIRRAEGRAHAAAAQQHERMGRVLQQAGIRVVVWNEDALPAAREIRRQVLGSRAAAPAATGPASRAAARPSAVAPIRASTPSPTASPTLPPVRTAPPTVATPAETQTSTAHEPMASPETLPMDFFHTGSPPDEVIQVEEPPISMFFDDSRFAPPPAPAPRKDKR